jgi:hypothetical protein
MCPTSASDLFPSEYLYEMDDCESIMYQIEEKIVHKSIYLVLSFEQKAIKSWAGKMKMKKNE